MNSHEGRIKVQNFILFFDTTNGGQKELWFPFNKKTIFKPFTHPRIVQVKSIQMNNKNNKKRKASIKYIHGVFTIFNSCFSVIKLFRSDLDTYSYPVHTNISSASAKEKRRYSGKNTPACAVPHTLKVQY